MAAVSAAALRSCAREAVMAAGGRGFVRFAPPGGALLVTDALRRCENEAAKIRLTGVLEAAGFVCCEQDGLLLLTPEDTRLRMEIREVPAIDWQSPLCETEALAIRYMGFAPQPLTAQGRRLVLETLRLTWQPKDKVLLGLSALRAQAAALLRETDTSGLYEAGRILYDWCREDLA